MRSTSIVYNNRFQTSFLEWAKLPNVLIYKRALFFGVTRLYELINASIFVYGDDVVVIPFHNFTVLLR